MYICISGAHSQGKTTLCNALKNNAMMKDYEFISSPIRDLQKQGFPINQDGDEVTQLFVISKYYEYSKKKGLVVADRCVLDGLAYTQAVLENFDDYEFKHALGIIASKCYKNYDIIFYIEPELELKEDGIRPTDREFFDKVVYYYDRWLENISTYKNPPKIIRLSGSVEERVSIFVHEVKKFIQTNYLVE
jgi:thymidylate kinase